MTWFVQSGLINPFSDPGLFIDFRFGRRALLFDLGELSPLSPRQLLRISHAFVSHAHMDHFAGFDRLLRICLQRAMPLHLVGPTGFADRVEHKLKAYTWNLLHEHQFNFSITAAEFTEAGIERVCEYHALEAFRRRELSPIPLPPGTLLDEDEFQIRSVVLDHGIPCLAFAFGEKLRVNVWREGLKSLQLGVGPWLNEAKRAVRRGAPDDSKVVISHDLSIPLGVLKKHALRTARGQKIAYVVDAAYHEENVDRILALARGADQLFIEAAFLDADADVAAQRRHLTARQAGDIAKRAGLNRFVPFHFSVRYREQEDRLRREAEQAFRA
jgi:ribonuclease Z